MKNNKGEVRGLINFLSLKRGGGGLIREGGGLKGQVYGSVHAH